jgi:undecaprenyl pyrophosphate phosphatase UppP
MKFDLKKHFKNKIKKSFAFFYSFILLMPVMVFAQQSAGGVQTGNNPAGGVQTGNSNSGVIFQNPLSGPNASNSIGQLVNNLFDAIIQIGLVFVVMAIIYAGLQFVLAQGNDDKLKKAKSIFLWTVIGGVILLGAGAISEVICNTANQFLTTKISC